MARDASPSALLQPLWHRVGWEPLKQVFPSVCPPPVHLSVVQPTSECSCLGELTDGQKGWVNMTPRAEGKPHTRSLPVTQAEAGDTGPAGLPGSDSRLRLELEELGVALFLEAGIGGGVSPPVGTEQGRGVRGTHSLEGAGGTQAPPGSNDPSSQTQQRLGTGLARGPKSSDIDAPTTLLPPPSCPSVVL